MRFACTVVGLAALALAESDAEACGGYFAPRENPTVVTDHRMIMTVAQGSSTLYDQISYSGDPASFAWILPYAGDITVGLSADVVFDALDTETQTTILPPTGCAAQFSSSGTSGASGALGGSSGSGGGSGVTVVSRQVVGPYDTVQLAATDPNALENWLAQNNFDIPADIQPVITTYVNEHFNFLALKLVPDKGITDMRPVRVTTKGSNIVLPLRMVAAGTGASVGITLWVLGGGRYEPQNFPYFVIDNNDLGWDPNQQRSNYTDLQTSLEAKTNGAGWEIESSTDLDTLGFEQQVRNGSYNGSSCDTPQSSGSCGGSGAPGPAPTPDYLPVKDANGNITETADQVREDDLGILTQTSGVVPGAVRITRMRSDISRTALTQDLQLRAAADQSVLSNTRQLTNCGIPSNPNSTVIVQAGQASIPPNPTPDAGTTPTAQVFSAGGGGCATTSNDTAAVGSAGIALAALVAARRRRAKR